MQMCLDKESLVSDGATSKLIWRVRVVSGNTAKLFLLFSIIHKKAEDLNSCR